MRSVSASSILLSIVLLSGLPAQRTWVVDARGGAGSDFKTLSAAVQRAASGDRVLVRAGVYEATTIAKPLSVFGETGAVLDLEHQKPSLRIENIPSGSVCSVRGFELRTVALKLVLTVNRCAGRVMLADLSLPQSTFPGGINIEESAAVSLDRCDFWTGISIRSSKVLATRCEIQRGIPGYPAMVSATDSHVTMVQCGVNRKNSVAAQHTVIYGISCVRSTLVLRGDADSYYLGGLELRRAIPWTVRHLALSGQADSHLVLDPQVQVKQPSHRGFTTVTKRDMPFAAATGGQLGEAIDLRLGAAAGAPYTLFVGLPGPRTPVPGLGDVWLDLRTLFPIQAGKFDSSGAAAVRRTVPATQSLAGLTLTYQMAAGAAPELSNGTSIVLWPR